MAYEWSIAEENLFTPRFGSMSVAEMRKVLFAVFISGRDDNPSPYEIGRQLGLKETQVRNLEVGANLLLEDNDATAARAQRAFREALQHWETLLVPLRQPGMVSVQINDDIALDFLSDKLTKCSVHREIDKRNGHVVIPLGQLQALLEIVAPEVDGTQIEGALKQQFPEFASFATTNEGKPFALLQKWLPQAANATEVLCFVSRVILQIVSGC